MIMLLFSWQGHCRSLLVRLSGECRMSPSGCRPLDEVNQHRPSVRLWTAIVYTHDHQFIIITQHGRWCRSYCPTEGRRLSWPTRCSMLRWYLCCSAGVFVVAVRPHHYCTGWRQMSELAHSPCLQVSEHGAALSYLTDKLSIRRTSRVDVVCVPPYHHRWLSALHSCQLSATKPFLSLLLTFGTVCRSMSRLQHHWRHTSLAAALLDCIRYSYCCVWEMTRCCYLLTTASVVGSRAPCQACYRSTAATSERWEW